MLHVYNLMLLNYYIQFPICEDDCAISVSCLDLYYAVRYKAKKADKNERDDKSDPIVLDDKAMNTFKDDSVSDDG